MGFRWNEAMTHNGDDAQSNIVPGRSRPQKSKLSPWRRLTRSLIGSVALLLICMTVPALRATASTAVPPGAWLMGTTVAIQAFDCSGLLCGRVVWLKNPVDAQGLLKRDINNPDPALRQRQVCGPTIIWNGHPTGPNRWEESWFYNPDDGNTYRASIELKSDDLMVVRIDWGLPIFGETRTLIRIPQNASEGWC